jgi:hypothetical protein
MRLFRVQNATGHGPFVSEDTIRVMNRAQLGRSDREFHNRFPTAYLAGLRQYGDDIRHAAPTLKALTKWFPRRIRRALAQRGFSLVEVDVPPERVKADNLQAVFEPEYAKLLASYPLAIM